MACDVVINFSGNRDPLVLQLYVDFSDNPLSDIAKALTADRQMLLRVRESFRKFYAIKSEGLSGKNNIGNTSIRELIQSTSIPGGWPSIEKLLSAGLDVDSFNILFTEENDPMFLKEGFYRLQVGSGNESRILKVNRGNLNKFRNWLLTNELLTGSLNMELSDEFKYVMEVYKIKEKELIKLYINGEKDFSNEFVTMNGRKLDVESIIQDLVYKMQSLAQKRIFNNELFNAIIGKVNEIKGLLFRYSLSLLTFYSKVSNLLKDDSDIKSILNNSKLTDTEKVKLIIDKLKSTDLDFPYTTISEIKDDTIIFNTPYLTLNGRYGLSYPEIQELFKKVGLHSGYDIYLREGKYYISRDPLTDISPAKTPYRTLLDAVGKIDSIVGYEYLSDQLNLLLKLGIDTLKYVNLLSYKEDSSTKKIYKLGEIIKSLDVYIDGDSKSKASKDLEILNLINNGTYNQFVTYIKNTFRDGKTQNEILTIVNDAEKAACFLYLRAGSDYIQALEKIKNANYKYYYVVKGFGKKGARVVSISEESIKKLRGEFTEDEEIRPEKLRNQDLPKAVLIDKFVDVILKRLNGTGFEVELLTQDEIKKKYSEPRCSAQGFVSLNKIVINGTIADVDTPLHEYAHVFLGLIKANNYKKYRELVSIVIENYDKGKKEKDRVVPKLRRKFKELYKGMSDSDIDEEVFADLFAGYILNSKYKLFVDLSIVRHDVTKEGGTIWDMIESDKSVTSLGLIWDYPLSSLTSLNSDFIIDLGEDDSALSRFKVFRQATNWIQQQINDGKIIENCI